MVGLEAGRPTYGFRFGEDLGQLAPVSVFASNGEVVFAAEPGEPLEVNPLMRPGIGSFCASDEASRTASENGAIVLGRLPALGWSDSLQFTRMEDESDLHSISMDSDGPSTLEFLFVPAMTDLPRQSFGETYPPTPVFARGWFQLWQLEGDHWVVSSDSGQISHRGDQARLRLNYIPQCGLEIYLNDASLIVLNEEAETIELSLGRGFLDRRWFGDIGVSSDQHAIRASETGSGPN